MSPNKSKETPDIFQPVLDGGPAETPSKFRNQFGHSVIKSGGPPADDMRFPVSHSVSLRGKGPKLTLIKDYPEPSNIKEWTTLLFTPILSPIRRFDGDGLIC
jgi:hypothetical protein